MRGACGFSGGVASSGSMTAAPAAAEVLEKDYQAPPDADDGVVRGDGAEESEGDGLELGLSLGAKKSAAGGGGNPPLREKACRILTARDFPSLASRASPTLPSPSNSSVSSSSGALGGPKRAAAAAATDPDSPNSAGSAHPSTQAVVGWPPIRAFRMNSLFNLSKDPSSAVDAGAPLKSSNNHNGGRSSEVHSIKGSSGIRKQERKRHTLFVKVNMDGDPIGRKVDLSAHHSYESLALSLQLMFHGPALALGVSAHCVEASKLLDVSSEFTLTYEDKDGDWMMVGDVPWGMFVDNVKRLRIMRTSDSSGFAPRFQSLNNFGGLIRSNPS